LQLLLELLGATNMKRWTLGSVAVGIALLGWPLFERTGFSAQLAPGWQPTIVAIRSPASNGGEPQLTASARGVLLSWIERHGSTATLRFAERTSTGWTEPRAVASGDDCRSHLPIATGGLRGSRPTTRRKSFRWITEWSK
jgi:hypothetical protein